MKISRCGISLGLVLFVCSWGFSGVSACTDQGEVGESFQKMVRQYCASQKASSEIDISVGIAFLEEGKIFHTLPSGFSGEWGLTDFLIFLENHGACLTTDQLAASKTILTANGEVLYEHMGLLDIHGEPSYDPVPSIGLPPIYYSNNFRASLYALPVGTYDVCVEIELTGDVDPANNKHCVEVVRAAPNFDCELLEIQLAPFTSTVTDLYLPYRNNGPETLEERYPIPAHFSIVKDDTVVMSWDGASANFDDTVSGEEGLLNFYFDEYHSLESGAYQLCIELFKNYPSIDPVPENNRLCQNFVVN